MTSARRLQANHNNAKKSTGPRTEAGKRRSAMNAIKHGMTARIAMLPGEDPAEFEELRRSGSRYAGRGTRLSWDRSSTLFFLRGAALAHRTRAESARVSFKSQTDQDDKRDREERAVVGLCAAVVPHSGRNAIGPGRERGGST